MPLRPPRRRVWALAIVTAAALASPAAGATRDVDGDGLADVALADYIDSIDAPGVTVLFGRADRTGPESRVEPGDRGFRITLGGTDTIAEAEVMGDANGDGLADVMVTDGAEAAIYVVFGRAGGEPVVVSDEMVQAGADAIRLDVSAVFARPVGDVDGDGLADLAHVRYGRHLARVRLGSGSGRPFRGSFDIDPAGRVRRIINPTLAPAGDVNGDGLGDVAIAVAEPGGRRDGFDVEEMVFVVFGKRDRARVRLVQDRRPSSARVVVGDCRRRCRRGGFAIRHARRGCWCSVSEIDPVGDLNGDGRDELAITWMDPFRDPRSRVDVVLGRAATSPVRLPGRGGAIARGADWVVPAAGIGDLDGDRRGDVLIGASPGRGLVMLPGRGVRRGRVLPVASLGDPLVAGRRLTFSRAAGDVDGDGADDLLAGWGLDEETYAIVYGRSPLAPVDLRRPGMAATLLP